MEELIAKIEGHGHLTIDWKKNKVELHILEGERLFEGILVGRPAEEASWITPRICGVCPTAHNLASLEAVEQALGIETDRLTALFRELMILGQIIQSHTLHLYFLSGPDYLGLDRATEMAKKNLALLKNGLALKKVSDQIAEVVGGRSTHPTRSTIGGFHQLPSQKSLKNLLGELEKTRSAAQATLKLFKSFDYPKLKVDLELVALKGDYIVSIASSQAETGQAAKSLVKDYQKDIEEEIRDYSTAKFARYRKREIMVGALARLAHRIDYDNEDQLDFQNPFHNNLAQAVEIKHSLERAEEIIKELLGQRLTRKLAQPAKHPQLKGIGALEAPRGSLYHQIHLNKKGLIVSANIITPTVQNLTSMEKSAQALLEQAKDQSSRELRHLLHMLIRAYDPCITCSVH